ncbi:hypothetical protein F4677DRAFT_342976 [Hypoxylon crocopeplum]|nr:hypothetical protein F4677DRAFT_342976 [Hypoxylon crocopeplum]
MASTAVHFPIDKDQGRLPYWPNNEELGVASENFFVDQFVTFDATDPAPLGGGELLEDPPSPSILLDSLNDILTNSSSNDLDTPSGQSQTEVAVTSASLEIAPLPSPQAPTLEQSKSVPPELTAPLLADPVLGGGSISDSELLRLEGISLKSPKLNATEPSSPHFTNTAPTSQRRHSRVLDSIYATFRRATNRTKPHKLQDPPPLARNGATTMVDTFERRGSACYEIPGGLDMSGFADIKLEEALDNHGLPLSPPLTSKIPPDQHSNDVMNFVTGHFEDPFCDNLLAPPAMIHPAGHRHDTNLDTPMHTPGLNDGTFYHHTMALMDSPNRNSFRQHHPQPKQRSTSSAEWPMEGILTSDNHTNNLWSASSPSAAPAYIPDGGGAMPSPEWWDPPQHTNGHQHSGHRGRTRTQNGVHNNATLNISMHSHQADLPYEYSNGNGGDISGLMIHMPQPRAPQAAVLSSSVNDSLGMSPSSRYYPVPAPGGHRHTSSSSSASSSHHGHNPHPHHRGHHSEQRRPRPRAPSSGARHYGTYVEAPLTSPRKMLSCYALREESASPTPRPHPRHRASSSSLQVRKRRSWTRRQAEPRTPGAHRSSSSARSASFDPGSGNRRNSDGGGGGGGLGGIEFCNYTPSDKKVLMNGVAPSGSSKTKARREREAQEHSRKLSEALTLEHNRKLSEAVRAAGGDVEKLRQCGYFNE